MEIHWSKKMYEYSERKKFNLAFCNEIENKFSLNYIFRIKLYV